MRFVVPAFAAAAVLAAAPASAAVISYAAPARASSEGRTQNTITGFDASLGTLNSAILSFEGTHSGIYTFQRGTDPQTSPFTLTPRLIPSAGSVVTSYNISGAPLTLTPPYEFNEANGRYQVPFSTQFSGQTPDLEIEYTGQGDTISYFLRAGVYVSYPGYVDDIPGGYNFTGTAVVTYDYAPAGQGSNPPVQSVPEPAGLALLGLGLVGLTAARRR